MAESEAEETPAWLEFAHKRGYISEAEFARFDDAYDKMVAQLVKLSKPRDWRIQ